MRPSFRGALCGLALGIVAGALPIHAAAPLPAQQLKALKAQEPQRTALALAQARSLVPTLGFQSGESLAVKDAFTNPEGRTVVRLDQTYGGYRVYGASAIGHVEADGRTKVLSKALRPNALPTGLPKLTAEQATAIAERHLHIRGKHMPPKVEQVVFPSELTGGIKPVYDPVQKKLVLDREYSVFSAPPREPYVWAYEVNLGTWNKVDGLQDVHLVIDANTGAVLRKLNNLKSQAAPGTPAKGTGHSQYSGDVVLDTTQSITDGTFALKDSTRGTLPNPYFHWEQNVDYTGIFTMYEAHEGSDPWDESKWWLNYWYEGKATNTWGDGQVFLDSPHEGDANGETAAVDAQYGLALTWDMYKNVFGRDGIDNKGTTPFAQVHIRNSDSRLSNFGQKMDNAYWSGWLFGMFFGDGTYTADTALTDAQGNPTPGNPDGMLSLTELDITAHELSHGLMDHTAGLSYGEESGGLNEASSDIFGALAEAYATAPAGSTTIPNTGSDWEVGRQVSPRGPLRSMKKPSKDGLSVDNWYEGMPYLDVHYSSGAMNRCFYYLSQGAPSDSGDEAHSPYVPEGMTGIGNDHAGRIWYKALTEYMNSQETYAQAGADLVSAATDLYGAGSAEVTAVKKAFTAINVQVEGEPLLTRVTFPVIYTDGWLGKAPGSPNSRRLVLPMGESVMLKGSVLNNPDQRLTWKVGGHLGSDYGQCDPAGDGVIHPDDTWTSPLRLGWYVMTAISKADPNQYAEGFVNVMNLDADDDLEQDAVDMGSSALSYYLEANLKPTHSPYGGPWVEDMDVAFFQAAIQSAWGKK